MISAIRWGRIGLELEFLLDLGFELLGRLRLLLLLGHLAPGQLLLGRLEVRLDLERLHLGLEQRVGRLGDTGLR